MKTIKKDIFMNVLAGTGAGRNRRPYLVREFLAKTGLSMHEVALNLGVSDTLVRETIIGQKNNKRVLNHLIELGCPCDFLGISQEECV